MNFNSFHLTSFHVVACPFMSCHDISMYKKRFTSKKTLPVIFGIHSLRYILARTSMVPRFSKAFPYHPATPQLPLSFPYQFAFFRTSKSNLFKVRVWSPTSGIRKQNWRDHQVLVWWTMELGGALVRNMQNHQSSPKSIHIDGRNPARKPVEVGSLSHYLEGLIHPSWWRISSINSMSRCSETMIC